MAKKTHYDILTKVNVTRGSPNGYHTDSTIKTWDRSHASSEDVVCTQDTDYDYELEYVVPFYDRLRCPQTPGQCAR
jgi:hypothetical protein